MMSMSASEQHLRPAAPTVPPGNPSAGNPTPELITLDRELIEEVCRLEARSYPAPWSTTLVRGEFEKPVSMRLGLRLGQDLIAYSFNYVVVDELHILNVAVAPEWRNMGYGRTLLKAVIETGREKGARYATLEVRVSNSVAKQLYEKFDFRVTGRRRAYYRNNGEDALVMERAL